jgi:hypothetical protein
LFINGLPQAVQEVDDTEILLIEKILTSLKREIVKVMK